VLAYTGEPRNSGINNWEVTKSHIDGDRQVFKNFATIASIAAAMRQALEKHDWTETARLLREEWSHRKKNAPGISTPLIDHMIEVTRRQGALAAKVCGAGGGGCVLFLIEPEARARVASLIEKAGATVLPVKVARRGVKVRVSK
jgi:D-glycero-alpha-D-manno-heptose-7-phosphate kinase